MKFAMRKSGRGELLGEAPAHAAIGDTHAFGAQAIEDGQHDRRRGHDDVGALRLEAGEARPLAHGEGGDARERRLDAGDDAGDGG